MCNTSHIFALQAEYAALSDQVLAIHRGGGDDNATMHLQQREEVIVAELRRLGTEPIPAGSQRPAR